MNSREPADSQENLDRDAIIGDGDLPTGQADALLTHVTHRAMATDFVIMLPPHAADAVEVALEALEMLDKIEASLTIYRPESEISRVNREAYDREVQLSRATFNLLERSVGWSQRTEGAFDVTAGPLVETWGFTRRNGRKPTESEILAARNLVGYQKLSLDRESRSVRFQESGMSINLGAIGKGDALDRLAGHLKASGVNDFLIHGGNSSLIAAGDQVAASGRGWAVGLAHPTKPKRRLAGIWLREMALATSGSGKQFFHHRGRRFGHVIDPRTGYPAGDLLALTVLMPSAADADACATGLFVCGRQVIGNIVTESDNADLVGEDWKSSPMILAASGLRQDEIDVETRGLIDWVAPPTSGRRNLPDQ